MQTMRDLMRGALARSLSTLTAEDRLAAALPLVCGSALAAHCEVDRLDPPRTLHLRVRGREWISPLLAMRDVLRSELGRVAGVPLDDLHFETGQIRPKTPETSDSGRNSKSNNRSFRRYERHVD